MENLNYAIKFVDNLKIGYLKTERAKYFLGEDGILSITLKHETQSSFSGKFSKRGELRNIPKEYMNHVTNDLEKLTHLYFVMQGKA